MKTDDIVALIITGIIGFVIIIISILLLNGCGSSLIAGYNTMQGSIKKKYDKNALCKFMGKILLPVGILIPLNTVMLIVGCGFFSYITIISILGLIIFATIYANTNNRFKNK